MSDHDADKVSRVRLMATKGRQEWDLSPNDIAALKHVVKTMDAALARAESAEAALGDAVARAERAEAALRAVMSECDREDGCSVPKMRLILYRWRDGRDHVPTPGASGEDL